jgi:hypothetical protein
VANEAVLSAAQAEVVYALLERQARFQEQFGKLQAAIREQADMLGKAYGLEGSDFRLSIDGDQVKVIGEMHEEDSD